MLGKCWERFEKHAIFQKLGNRVNQPVGGIDIFVWV